MTGEEFLAAILDNGYMTEAVVAAGSEKEALAAEEKIEEAKSSTWRQTDNSTDTSLKTTSFARVFTPHADVRAAA